MRYLFLNFFSLKIFYKSSPTSTTEAVQFTRFLRWYVAEGKTIKYITDKNVSINYFFKNIAAFPSIFQTKNRSLVCFPRSHQTQFSQLKIFPEIEITKNKNLQARLYIFYRFWNPLDLKLYSVEGNPWLVI